MTQDDLLDQEVDHWSTPKYEQLSNGQDRVILELKAFLRNTNWKVLVIYHDKECSINSNHPTYGSHLHLLWKTSVTQPSQDKQYRRLHRLVLQEKGYVKLRKLARPTKINVSNYINYLINDEEKLFLGTNDKCEEPREYTVKSPKRKPTPKSFREDCMRPGAVGHALGLGESAAKDVVYDDDMNDNGIEIEPTKVPDFMVKDKSSDTFTFFYNIIRKHPEVERLNVMIGKYDASSKEFKALCTAVAQASGDKIFNAARHKYMEEMSMRTAYDAIQSLPDDLDKYMTPSDSFKIFNSWCVEQGIPERWLYVLLNSLLKGRGKKKIGLYLQGEADSGKTMLSSSIFECIPCAGKIAKDNFPWQMLGNKKIVLGEEIFVTQVNIDKYKDLLSGSKATCERKGTTPAYCKADMCLLNSNIKFGTQLTTSQMAIMKTRLFFLEGLRKSTVLKQAYGLLHPKLFTLATHPSDDECMICMDNDRTYFQNTKNILVDDLSEKGNNSYFNDCFDNDSDNETEPQASTSRGKKRKRTVPLDRSYDAHTECSTPKRLTPSSSLTIIPDFTDDTSESISDIPGFQEIPCHSITEFFQNVSASQIEDIAQCVEDNINNHLAGNLEQYIQEHEYLRIPDEDTQ